MFGKWDARLYCLMQELEAIAVSAGLAASERSKSQSHLPI
jgi:hypothetical protein